MTYPTFNIGDRVVLIDRPLEMFEPHYSHWPEGHRIALRRALASMRDIEMTVVDLPDKGAVTIAWRYADGTVQEAIMWAGMFRPERTNNDCAARSAR